MKDNIESLRLERVTRRFGGPGSPPALNDLSMTVKRGEFIALLGPSGCGKSTALNCIAGLVALSDGAIWLNDERLDVVAPEHRGLGMVFQNYALFPHMTVRKNVQFGLMMRGVPAAERQRRTAKALALVQLEGHEDKLPGQLSGGQQQRVAIARAIVVEPRLVLMDEPLSNLDAQLRARMRDEIRQIQRRTGITVLYVTHDQSEALSMSDRVVVMNQGTVQQVGDPWALYHRPENAFVATFVGDANVLPAVVTEVGSHAFTARVPTLGQDAVFDIARAAAADCPATGDEISLVFRPEWAQVSKEDGVPPTSFGRNEIGARLVSSEFLGDHFERSYVAGEHRLRVQAVTGPTSRPPEIGAEQALLITPENLTWFRGGVS